MAGFSYIGELIAREAGKLDPVRRRGRVVELIGPLIKAVMPRVRLGELCELIDPWRGESAPVTAEVIGFSDGRALLTPITGTLGLSADAHVIPTGRSHRVAVGPTLLGQVVDGMGRRIGEADTQAPVPGDGYPIYAEPPDALLRQPIRDRLITGIRAIDGLLSCGVGQRLGIFAAAGVGKSTLLASLARNTEVDVCVLALIGERGREVREFLERQVPREVRRRMVTVVATSDKPAMQRVRAAYVATAIAEYFRDTGASVLLLMDSVTRFARALREVGLAAGEPPTRRGYPASMFSALPKLFERAGPGERGAITGIYTVLVEGDDLNEPVADEVRSLLDGHIVLSQDLAAANHYPAIDILDSRSRLMDRVADQADIDHAARIRRLLAKYNEIELLVQVGEYRPGSDPEADDAIQRRPAIQSFLRQGPVQRSALEATTTAMREVLEDVR